MVESGCFRTKVLDQKGKWADLWFSYNDGINAGWPAVGSDQPSMKLIAKVQAAFLKSLRLATGEAFAAVSNSPDRSIVPWIAPKSLDPRFPTT